MLARRNFRLKLRTALRWARRRELSPQPADVPVTPAAGGRRFHAHASHNPATTGPLRAEDTRTRTLHACM